MTRTARSRTRTTLFKTGTTEMWDRDRKHRIVNGSNSAYNSYSCNDFHGRPITDSAFTATSKTGAAVLNGSFQLAAMYGYHYDYHDSPLQLSDSALGGALVPIPAPNGWMLDLVAGTNPSRPVVTPLTLLQDLMELPAQLRDIGRSALNPSSLGTPKGAASSYLGFQFGWAPLVDDLNKLLNLQSYIAKRAKELDDLATKGIKRRLQFGSDTSSSSYTYRISGGGIDQYVDIPFDIFTKRKAWATIHWYPTNQNYSVIYHDKNIQLARRIVLGMTSEGTAKGLWDVVPWTWLIGWFTNVGKLALANSNTVPATHGNGCFMSSVEQWTMAMQPTFHRTTPEGFTVADGVRRTLKTRQIGSAATPGVNVPFLDTFRLSILSSLAIQRLRR